MSSEIKMPKFSARLKELRKERGIKQKEMAEVLGCQVNHYQRIDYGQINIPALMLEFLADYFEVSTDYLLGRTEVRETAGQSDQAPLAGSAPLTGRQAE